MVQSYIKELWFYKESFELENYYKFIGIYDLYLKNHEISLVQLVKISKLSLQLMLRDSFDELLGICLLYFYLDLIFGKINKINKVSNLLDDKLYENLFFIFFVCDESIWFFLNSFLKYINWFFLEFRLLKFFYSFSKFLFNLNFINFFFKECYFYNFFFFKFIFTLDNLNKNKFKLKNSNFLFFSNLGFKFYKIER